MISNVFPCKHFLAVSDSQGDGAKAKPPREKDRGLLKGLFRSGPRVELATPMQPGDEEEEDDREVLRTRHVVPSMQMSRGYLRRLYPIL